MDTDKPPPLRNHHRIRCSRGSHRCQPTARDIPTPGRIVSIPGVIEMVHRSQRSYTESRDPPKILGIAEEPGRRGSRVINRIPPIRYLHLRRLSSGGNQKTRESCLYYGPHFHLPGSSIHTRISHPPLIWHQTPAVPLPSNGVCPQKLRLSGTGWPTDPVIHRDRPPQK